MSRNKTSSGSGGPCGACKFLRRKCIRGCIFAPYFDPEQGVTRFAAVHKVFGASNVSKLLVRIPDHKRLDAVITICYEAQARLRDPVYGCVSHIFALQQQVVNLQNELAYVQTHLSSMELPSQPCNRAGHTASSSLVPVYDLPPFSRHPPETANDENPDDMELQLLAQEFLSRIFPGSQLQTVPKSV